MNHKAFPEGFIWGAATSSQQIEGGRHDGGRGESIWDRFCSVKGNIADLSNSDVACDHFNRWPEDVELMKWLGLGAYRFSISWPRILPKGKGAINTAGLDFYDKLVDRLLESGIEPFSTLYHWDLPQALQDEGGWGSRESVDHFENYTSIVTKRLGDRVKNWITHNEPWCISVLGNEEGCHAPGFKDPELAMRVSHHLLLSHGRATKVIRDQVQGAEVGIVLIHCPSHPASDSKKDHEAARWFDGFFNRWFHEAVFKGSYPADAIADRMVRGHLTGPVLPFVKPGDMETISTPLDFLGLNYYSRNVMGMDENDQPEAITVVPKEDLTDMGWEVYPDGLLEGLLHINKTYRPKKIFITENGAAYDVPADADGRIRDEKRIHYLREHLTMSSRAIAAGVPLAGYFAWSLLDNFEWALGYEKKFGLISVDYKTLKRTPKDSAFWYRDTIAKNAVGAADLPPTQGE